MAAGKLDDFNSQFVVCTINLVIFHTNCNIYLKLNLKNLDDS